MRGAAARPFFALSFVCSFFLSFPFFWCINPRRKGIPPERKAIPPERKAIPPGRKEIPPGRKGIPLGEKGDLRGISGRNPVSPSAAALVQRKRKSRVCARRKPRFSALLFFVAFVQPESFSKRHSSGFIRDESRQSSLTPRRRRKISADAMSIRMHTRITSSCLLPAPSRCRLSVMVTNWRPKVTPSSAPRLHIVE